MLLRFCVVSVFSIISIIEGQDGPVVQTTYGDLRGAVRMSDSGAYYEEYLGIPYAAPPVGDLRWRKPIVPQAWDGIRDAAEFGAHCIHLMEDNYLNDWGLGVSNETSEDCLFINVWVPGTDREGDNLAVMVYVHGGGYYSGSGALYPTEDLALHGEVIVVTMNYRLGTLGFLSTEDEAAPGNFALWDTQLALQWVQENIAAFGGDVDRITVFGYSAGGAMTSHIAVSPATKGLMHRAISLSGQGSAFYGIALEGSPAKSAEALARRLGCRNWTDSFEMIDCLRGVDAQEVAFWGVVGTGIFRTQVPNMIPVIDGDFIPQHPELSWREGAAADIDFMTGSCEHDSQSYVTLNSKGYPEDPLNVAATNESLLLFFGIATAHYPEGDAGVDAIYDQYPLLTDEDLDTRTRETVRATTDWWFKTYKHVEGYEHARTRNTAHSTYTYNFKYRQSFLQYPHEWVTGSHADDMYSIFGYNHRAEFRIEELGADFNEDDFFVSEQEMTYLTNFAISGDPNTGQSVTMEWPLYNTEDKQYLEISSTPQPRNETDEMLRDYYFWQVEFPAIVNPQENNDRKWENSNGPNDEWDYEFELEEEDIYAAVEALRDYLHQKESLSSENHYLLDKRIDHFLEQRLLRVSGMA